MGRKKKAHYRVVIADSKSPRDGRFVETVGYYKPLSRPARLVLDLEAVDRWIERGAQPSQTVRSLIRKARIGGDGAVAIGELSAIENTAAAKPRREATKAERIAEEAAARAAEEDAAAPKPEREATKAEKIAEEAAARAAEEERAAESERAAEEE